MKTTADDDGGSVDNIEIWGRGRLAYKIDKFAEGIYAVVALQAEAATVKELDQLPRDGFTCASATQLK